MEGTPKYIPIPETTIPKSLRDYLFYRKHHAAQFTPSAEIPIADTDNPDVLRKLISYMKLHLPSLGRFPAITSNSIPVFVVQAMVIYAMVLYYDCQSTLQAQSRFARKER